MIDLYVTPSPGVNRPYSRLRLGDPVRTAPACDECRRPANLELAGRAYCAPCLEHVTELGLEVIAGNYLPRPE